MSQITCETYSISSN